MKNGVCEVMSRKVVGYLSSVCLSLAKLTSTLCFLLTWFCFWKSWWCKQPKISQTCHSQWENWVKLHSNVTFCLHIANFARQIWTKTTLWYQKRPLEKSRHNHREIICKCINASRILGSCARQLHRVNRSPSSPTLQSEYGLVAFWLCVQSEGRCFEWNCSVWLPVWLASTQFVKVALHCFWVCF